MAYFLYEWMSCGQCILKVLLHGVHLQICLLFLYGVHCEFLISLCRMQTTLRINYCEILSFVDYSFVMKLGKLQVVGIHRSRIIKPVYLVSVNQSLNRIWELGLARFHIKFLMFSHFCGCYLTTLMYAMIDVFVVLVFLNVIVSSGVNGIKTWFRTFLKSQKRCSPW